MCSALLSVVPDSHTATIGHESACLRLTRGESGPGPSGRHELWSLTVQVEEGGLHATARVGLLDGVEPPLSDLFDDMAANWRGWHDAKEWAAYEGGLRLSCTHDGLGHVAVSIELVAPADGWVIHAVIPVEAGQLDQIASQVRQLVTISE